MRINYQLCRPAYASLHRPSKAHPDDAGIDLRAATTGILNPGEWAPIPTGIRLALPRGWEAQIRPRSGLAANHAVTVLNAPGTVDAGFRGEVRAILINHGHEPWSWEEGDRIAQLVVKEVPHVVLTEVDDLDTTTTRGNAGLGSTGVH
ncbi:dUTP diphosphatase [Corynebacterium provencense]|uniref:dUTP diphosphatase n=1 Tax=Corynebacterium provencense TaxID=1737425 RepID=UPI00082CCAE7|nr:dUTP diphosphatase [Corynebacterium provencense]